MLAETWPLLTCTRMRFGLAALLSSIEDDLAVDAHGRRPSLPFLPLLSPGLMGWALMSESAHHSNWWRLSWASWAALAKSSQGSPMTR